MKLNKEFMLLKFPYLISLFGMNNFKALKGANNK